MTVLDPLTEAEARAEVLTLFQKVGCCSLSGNRESWSELVWAGADYHVRAGDHHSNDVFTARISENEAWNRLRSLALDRLGLYTFAEQARARPEAIAAWFRDLWARSM